MKIRLPFTPKAKLMDILQRRRQTLASFVQEMGIKNAMQLEVYCNVHKLQVPDVELMVDAFVPDAQTARPGPRQPLIVEVPTALQLVIEQVREEKEESKKRKRVKNALVQLGEDSSAPEAEKKAV